jgi:hypothetical protein
VKLGVGRSRSILAINDMNGHKMFPVDEEVLEGLTPLGPLVFFNDFGGVDEDIRNLVLLFLDGIGKLDVGVVL